MPEYIPPSLDVATAGVTLPEGELDAVGKLIKVMARLRMPDGCPWDQAQTHESLLPNLLEESYEYVHAVQEGDLAGMKEELGDLLLQVIFHAQIAQEAGQFDLGQCSKDLAEKLVRRHPHVFGEQRVADAHEALASWSAAKRKEGVHTVALDKVPRAMPALLRARKVQEKAAKAGFQWPDVDGAMVKVDEELKELREAMSAKKNSPSSAESLTHSPPSIEGGVGEVVSSISEEIGDLLFAIVNVARYLHIDPETALIGTIEKFITRFDYIEKRLEERGVALGDAGLLQMDALWDEAKSGEIKR